MRSKINKEIKITKHALSSIKGPSRASKVLSIALYKCDA